jgi:hypothetical protein
MACRRIGALASAYLDGTLAGPERRRFEAHAGECPGCHAYLEELRLVVRAAARLRPETGASDTAPQYPAAVEALRHHGRPAARDRVLDVPLGIGEQTAAFGDHIVYPWESEREFRSTAGFLATGLERGEACVLFGHDRANRRVLAALEDLGLSVPRLTRGESLLIASPSTSGDALLGALDDRVKRTVDRGVIGVRVLGNLGWGEPDWPVDEEVLRLEARVTDAVRLYPAVVLCAYDVATVPARGLHEGGFECHPLILRRDALGPSDAYVPAERFLAKLERG